MEILKKTMEILKKTMDFFQKTMDFFQKNSHVFRISWEIIEGTREKREKQKVRRNIHKGIHGKKQKGFHGRNKKDSTAETNPQQQKQIHGKNKKDSTAETENVKIRSKTNPRQKQKGFHTK